MVASERVDHHRPKAGTFPTWRPRTSSWTASIPSKAWPFAEGHIWRFSRAFRYMGAWRRPGRNAPYPPGARWMTWWNTGGKWDFLGDWLWPGAKGVNGDTRETLFFNNCFWIYNLQTASRIAGALGKVEAAARYRARAEQARQAVHAAFYGADPPGYVNNQQATLAIALLVGLPPKVIEPAVWKRFEEEILIHRRGHFWGGITGGYFVVKALIEFDRPDLMYRMATQTGYPGWADMIRRGATTLWESWEGDKSLLHSSYLHVGAWFMEGLAGIRPDPEHPGYQHFVIKPPLPTQTALDWVKASYNSQYGPIVSHWRIRNGRYESQVTIPSNTTATLYLPLSGESIREGRRSLAEARGVTVRERTKTRTVLLLQSGRYLFEGKIGRDE
ncbi:MAG: hypothetical protein IIA65_03435 [Planctomycetes bacterium]|nr:hypothetical protein [Planctomycetota bacterium]